MICETKKNLNQGHKKKLKISEEEKKKEKLNESKI